MKKNKSFTNSFIYLFFITFFSAVLFFLANPNFIFKNGIGFLAWIYYIPVLYVVKKSDIKYVYLLGFLYGLVSYGLYSYWLCKSYLWAFFVVVIAYGVIYGFVFLLLKLCNKLFVHYAFLIQVLVLCSFEYIRTLGFLGLGYGVTAYTQWKNLFLIQICDSIGVFGLNYFIICFSGVCYAVLEKIFLRKKEVFSVQTYDIAKVNNMKRFVDKEKLNKSLSLKFNLIIFALLSSMILFFYIYGSIKISRKTPSQKIKICAIQSNENPWDNSFADYKKNVNSQIKLTAEALELDPEIQLVVWPETAVVPAICYNYYYGKPNRQKLINDLLNYIESTDVSFLIGNGHKLVSNKNNSQIYNSALFFDSKNPVFPPRPEIYSKNKLVPFVEYFPYQKYFPSIYKKLIINGNQMWNPGNSISVIKYDDFIFGTPICFEDTFSFVCRKMAMKNCDCFINLTNDSWSESQACQNQHTAMAVFRSVENGIPTLRCTTNGKTCVINKNGKITDELPGFAKGYLITDVDFSLNHKKTMFTRIGDIFGIIEVVSALLLLIIQLFIVKIKKNKN